MLVTRVASPEPGLATLLKVAMFWVQRLSALAQPD
jgi:hypothetical protein